MNESSKGSEQEPTIEISVIVPVYREEGTIVAFLQRLEPALQAFASRFEIIFCLDPSPDRTEQVILEQRRRDERIKLIKFSRRFGQPMATLAGMQYSSGQAVVVMDVDLQDPPEIIAQMVKKWREGFDVVYAQRKGRTGETLVKRLVSALGYRLINRIAEVEIPKDTGDFRLMSRRVVNEVNKLKECHGFLRGLVALVGFRQTSVLFDRAPRSAGKGNYNRFLGSLRIGLNGVVCFSDALLTLSSIMGFLTAGFAFLLAVAYFCMRLAGSPFPIGNPTIVILVLFLGGVQLVSIGILGQYVARIYQEVKARPKFIVDQSHGFRSLPHE